MAVAAPEPSVRGRGRYRPGLRAVWRLSIPLYRGAGRCHGSYSCFGSERLADQPGITALSWGKRCGSPIARLPSNPTPLSLKLCGRDAGPRGRGPKIGSASAGELSSLRATRGGSAGGLGRPFLLVAAPGTAEVFARCGSGSSVPAGVSHADQLRLLLFQLRPFRAAASNGCRRSDPRCGRQQVRRVLLPGDDPDLMTTYSGKAGAKTLVTKSQVSLQKPIDAHKSP